MILCKYSTIEIYKKWKNGIPISEIVKITGIKRKTWYKRFERLEKKINSTTNSSSELINKNNKNIPIKNNGDIGDKSAKNAGTVANGDRNKFLLLITIVGLTLVLGFLIERIYDSIMKGKENAINSENNKERVSTQIK